MKRWSRFFRRLLAGFVLAFIVAIAPCSLWTPDVFTYWQVPVTVLVFILYIGVLLYDTLFYDRYH